MRLKIVFLTLLITAPAVASFWLPAPGFDQFLPRFRMCYEKYHFGKHLPQKDVDKIGLMIWLGSGKDWLSASTTACQCVCESHFELSANPSMKYRGHIGMHKNTILVEARRIGVIKKNKRDYKAMWHKCYKDPSYADFLSASRLVFLTKHYGSRRRAIYQYVGGQSWMRDVRIFHRVDQYWNTVERIRLEIF